MKNKIAFRAALITFLAISSIFLLISAIEFYSYCIDIKSLKYLTVCLNNLKLKKLNNATYLSFNLQLNNSAEGKVIIVFQKFELTVEDELIQVRSIDFSHNELIIHPYGSINREVSLEIPSFKLYLFKKENVLCKINVHIYLRTPYGRVCFTNSTLASLNYASKSLVSD